MRRQAAVGCTRRRGTRPTLPFLEQDTFHKQGNAYTGLVASTGDRHYFMVMGAPLGKLKGEVLTIDETGVLRAALPAPCPPGLSLEAVDGQLQCVWDLIGSRYPGAASLANNWSTWHRGGAESSPAYTWASFWPFRDPASSNWHGVTNDWNGTEASPTVVPGGIAAMEEAALLMPGAGALDEAQKVLGDPTFLPAVQRDLDVDGDLKVSLSEALDVDRILAILRARAKIDVVSPEIDALVRRFVQRQRQQFQLDVNEEEPAAPLHTIEGSPTLIVEFAADSVPFASLDVLLDEVANLDTTKDMTGDPETNARRKAMFLGSVQGMPAMLRFGETKELLQLLGKWRAVVDGDGSPPDSVSGPAALRIRQRIDATVAMLNVLVAVR